MWLGLALAMVLLNVSHGWSQVSEWPGPTPGQLDPLIAWKRGYIEGYTPTPSVRQGDVVEFKLSTTAAWVPGGPNIPRWCAMDIFRVTSRTPLGAGDQLIQANVNGSFLVGFYPLRDSAGGYIEPFDYSRYPYDYRRGCDDLWATAARCTVQNTWPSGFYYARVHLVNEGNYGYVPFVVRPRDPANSQAKILCVISWNTYQAYNYWGGGSLYWWLGRFGSPDDGGASIKTVSFRRPFTDFWQEAPPAGWPITTQLGQVDARERQFIAWAEENATEYPIDYCIDADVHADTLNFLASYKMLVFPGHSEYWTFDQRRNIEHQQTGFKGQGGNLAFLAANNCYWRVDYRPSAPPTANPDSMYCDKSGNNYWWRKQPVDTATSVGGPEARFIGVQYMGNNYPGYQGADTLLLPQHWISRGTGLASGSVFGLGHNNSWFVNRLDPIAAGEADMVRMASPSTTQKLGSVFIRSLDSLNDPHYNEEGTTQLHSNVAYYEDIATNSRVFAAGGFGWSHCLYGDDSTTMRIMHRAVLDHFSGNKYIGNVYSQPPFYVLEWTQDIGLDGDVVVLSSALLRMTDIAVTADSVLFVNGTCEINGAVTVAGNGSLTINPGGILLLKANSTLTISPSAYFVLESGGDVVFESGAKLVLSYATIEAGATLSVESDGILQIAPAGHIAFGVGAGLSISGTLTAEGTSTDSITFTRSGISEYWFGITLQASSSAAFDYCEILHAQVGIIAAGVQPTINHCTVDSCKIGISLFQSAGQITNSTIMHNIIKGISVDGEYGLTDPPRAPAITDNGISSNTTGIYVTNAAPVLERNTIAENTNVGLWCDNSNPFVGKNEADSPGENTFAANGGANLLAEDYSFPFVGYAEDEQSDIVYGGYNSFGPEKHEYDVWARNTSGVMARKNYWSEYPPDEETSFKEEADDDWIDWSFPLESFGDNPMFSGTSGVVSSRADDPPHLSNGLVGSWFDNAMTHRSKKRFARSIALARQYIAQNPAASFVPFAFVVLHQIVQDSARVAGNSAIVQSFSSYADSVLSFSASERIRQVLINAKRNRLIQRRAWHEAIALAETISTRYPNSVLDEHALYGAVMSYLFGLGDRQAAQQMHAILNQRFPNSQLSAAAAVLISATAAQVRGTNASSPKLAAGTAEETPSIPGQFAVYQNYPNPFNPTTTIKYDLPIDAHVTLTLYDVLGREVGTLVDEQAKGGYHSATLDASRLSSGVYFYRMQAGGFSQTKKLLLLR